MNIEEEPVRRAVDQFIADEIDTVPHLEALLMLWNSRPKQWPVADVAKALYIPEDEARKILQELTRRGLISQVTGQSESYSYQPESEEKDALLGALDAIYRRQVVRISTMIHSKASAAVRDFARAFRFTKDKE
jgi:predicted ArsR family transcriptional regulator